MTPAMMFWAAMAAAVAFFGTVIAVRLWLWQAQRQREYPRRPQRQHPEALRVCATVGREEEQAVQVLQRVQVLLPGLDLNMMKRQVHP